MRARQARGALAALGVTVALLAAACGSAGAPVDLGGNVAAERPTPANAGAKSEGPAKKSPQPDCGDATVSLRPRGLSLGQDSTMAEIKQNGILRAGVDQNTFLFGHHNPNTGKLEGFDIEIAKEIAKAIFGDEDRIAFIALTSDQRIPALKDGQVDIVVRTMTINCERRQDIEFSGVYYVAHQKVLVPQSSRAESLTDLGGKKVCATKSSTSLKTIEETPSEPVPVSVDNWSDCLVMMQQGQVDAVSTDDTILAGMARQDPTLKVEGDNSKSEPYGIGIPKQNTDMVRFVNAVLDKLRSGGRWQEIYRKWVQPSLGAVATPRPKYK